MSIHIELELDGSFKNLLATDEDAIVAVAAPDLLKVCKNNIEPLLRYESCLQSYAKKSAHKGNRDNQSFWEERTRAVIKLSKELKQVIAKAEGVKK